MPSKNRKSLKLLRYSLITVGILLVLLLVTVNLLVPYYINRSLKSISDSKDIRLETQTAGFGFSSGIKLSGLTLTNGKTRAVLVNNVSVKPAYLESVKERKLIIDQIILKGSFLDLSGGSVSTFSKLFSSSEDTRPDDKPEHISEPVFEIKKIKADNLQIKTGKNLKVDLKNLEIYWNQISRVKDSFDFGSQLALNGNGDSGMEGKVELNRIKKNADVYLQINNTAGLYKNSRLRIPAETYTKLRANINYKTGLESKGKVNIHKQNGKETGELFYSLDYKDGNLAFKKGRVQLDDFADFRFSGKVEDIGKENLFNLKSRLEIEDLNKLSEWTDYVKEGELRGSFTGRKLSLKNTSEDKQLLLTGTGKFDNTAYRTESYSIENLNSDFKFEFDLKNTEARMFANLDTGSISAALTGEVNLSAKKLYTGNPAEITFRKTADNQPVIQVKGIRTAGLEIMNFRFATVDARLLKYSKNENTGFTFYSELNGRELVSESFRASDVNGDLNIKNNHEENSVYGNIGFKNGSTGSYSVKNYSGNYSFENNGIRLENSALEADYLESAKIESAIIKLPAEEKAGIGINIENAVLTALDGKLTSGIKNADLIFDKTSSGLSGTVITNSFTFQGNDFNNLNFDINYLDNKLEISDLKSGLLKGKLRGKGWINLRNSPAAFSAELEAKDITLVGGGNYPLKKLSTSVKGTLDNGSVNATGKIGFEDLKVSKDLYSSQISGSAELISADETIYIQNGFIKSEDSEEIGFQGSLKNYRSENRLAQVDISETDLDTLKKVFYPMLPFEVQEGDVSGTLKTRLDLSHTPDGFDWNGKIAIKDANLYTLFSLTEFTVEGVNGVVTVDKSVISKNPLFDVIGQKLQINREVYSNYLDRLEKEKEKDGNSDYLKVERVNYGFLDVRNIETNFEMNHSKLNLNYFKCDIYDGRIIGTGLYNLKNSKYNVSILFDDMSLSSISDSIPSIRDYITGRFNGMMWINDGNNLGSIDGLFSLWTLDSDREKRSIGRALLEKIGATGRFFTGSSRRYDKGLISGYIKEGFMTFKEMEISNTFLGYKDLKILVDEKKNSISIKQLLSVIREIAKRASEGGIQLDFEKKKE